jgi:hypothetical protein
MSKVNKEKLEAQLSFLVELLSPRGVGHTRLMTEGIMNYEGRYAIVGKTHSEARELLNSIGADQNNSVIYSLNSSKKSFGTATLKLPVAIDNWVLKDLLQSVLIQLTRSTDDKEVNDIIAERIANVKPVEKIVVKYDESILSDVMCIAEIYQERTHVIESLLLEYLRCNWWQITKKLDLKSQILEQSIKNYSDEKLDSILKKYKK